MLKKFNQTVSHLIDKIKKDVNTLTEKSIKNYSVPINKYKKEMGMSDELCNDVISELERYGLIEINKKRTYTDPRTGIEEFEITYFLGKNLDQLRKQKDSYYL